MASHQFPASQKGLNGVTSLVVTWASSSSTSTRTCSQNSEEQNGSSGGVSSPDRFSSSWPFESMLVLAKLFFATMGLFLQALERNGALCLPAFDDQMALLFPILQQSLEEFPKQPPLFSTSSSFTSLLTEILGWRQNCHWWSLRCVSERALPTTAWSSPPAAWECADSLHQNSCSSLDRRCRVHSLTFTKPPLVPWFLPLLEPHSLA